MAARMVICGARIQLQPKLGWLEFKVIRSYGACEWVHMTSFGPLGTLEDAACHLEGLLHKSTFYRHLFEVPRGKTHVMALLAYFVSSPWGVLDDDPVQKAVHIRNDNLAPKMNMYHPACLAEIQAGANLYYDLKAVQAFEDRRRGEERRAAEAAAAAANLQAKRAAARAARNAARALARARASTHGRGARRQVRRAL